MKRHLSSLLAIVAIASGGAAPPRQSSLVFDPGYHPLAPPAEPKVRRPKSAKRLRNRKRRGWR